MSATIQRPKRVSTESVDTDEAREAVSVVGDSVNTFMEEAYIAIMGNLGVTSNLNMEFKTLKVTVNASGIPIQSVTFKSNLKTKLTGCSVIRAFMAIPTNYPFITFNENSGLVTIQHISGLVANTEYQLLILTIGQ